MAAKRFLFANNAFGQLKLAIAAVDVTLTLNTNQGALFPAPNAANNEAFRATLIDVSGNLEIIECTQRGADVFTTIARGQEGTVPLAFAAGSRVSMRVTKEILESLRDSGGWLTGDHRVTLRNVAASGWILANDGTIGNVGSGANYAAADAQALFTLLWNNVSNANAPVSGGRGVSAASDWGALKTIQLTKLLGRALAIAGAGSGLTARLLGDFIGEENHTLTNAEVPATPVNVTDPAHAHNTPGGSSILNGGGGGWDWNSPGAVVKTTATQITGITAAVAGGGGGHNTMQPTGCLNVEIKL